MAFATAYDALINASSKLTGGEDVEEGVDGELKLIEAYVAANRTALESARDAIRMQPVLPFRYESSLFDERCNDYRCFRALVQGLRNELRLAELQGDLHRVVEIGIDLLDLFKVVRCGGLIVDFLVSISIGQSALNGLRRIRSDLDEADRKFVMDALLRIEKDLEPYGEIAERDREWEVIAGCDDEPTDVVEMELMGPEESGFSEDQQRAAFEAIQMFANMSENEKKSINADLGQLSVALMRMLYVDLALRSYRYVHSEYPQHLDSLADVVPTMDPFTGQPFHYRRISSEEFSLYSVGPGRVDHGGKFGSHSMVNMRLADFCLDYFDLSSECCPIPFREQSED